MNNKLKHKIFVSVAAALVDKWPTNSTKDREDIADTALKLTNTLYNKYISDTTGQVELLQEDQFTQINDQVRVPKKRKIK